MTVEIVMGCVHCDANLYCNILWYVNVFYI